MAPSMVTTSDREMSTRFTRVEVCSSLTPAGNSSQVFFYLVRGVTDILTTPLAFYTTKPCIDMHSSTKDTLINMELSTSTRAWPVHLAWKVTAGPMPAKSTGSTFTA